MLLKPLQREVMNETFWWVKHNNFDDLSLLSYIYYLPPLRMYSLIEISQRYKIQLNSDEAQYGGHGRIQQDTEFFSEPLAFKNRPNSFLVSCFSIMFSSWEC